LTPIARSADYLPFGLFPRIEGGSVVPDPGTLGEEVQNLGTKVKDTVKTFASYRDTTCFGDPCLFQAFPLMYSIQDSGFFGGFRAKLTNISAREPYLYSLETGVVRSDTQQWNSFLSLDVPAVKYIPFRPRVKMKSFYLRTTESRWYGTGKDYDVIITDEAKNYRYSATELGINSSIIFPLFQVSKQKVNLFGTFSSIKHNTRAFSDVSQSKLFLDQPRGFNGGISSRLGFGILLDSRDREELSRVGWALEIAAEYSSPPVGQYDFRRFTVIDRRYVSKGRWTLANRLTLDGITGQAPFWELSSIGGIDPILDLSQSQILRGFPNGRFHETFKIINSAELRLEFAPVRIFGLHTQFFPTLLGVDLGRISDQSAAGVSSGLKILFNRNLLVQIYVASSRDDKNINFSFGQDY